MMFAIVHGVPPQSVVSQEELCAYLTGHLGGSELLAVWMHRYVSSSGRMDDNVSGGYAVAEYSSASAVEAACSRSLSVEGQLIQPQRLSLSGAGPGEKASPLTPILEPSICLIETSVCCSPQKLYEELSGLGWTVAALEPQVPGEDAAPRRWVASVMGTVTGAPGRSSLIQRVVPLKTEALSTAAAPESGAEWRVTSQEELQQCVGAVLGGSGSGAHRAMVDALGNVHFR